MTDRELLERAAKAAGHKATWMPMEGGFIVNGNQWAPLEDDGDALRLAVKLHMTLRCYMGTTVAQIGVPGLKSVYEEVTDKADPYAATRRAIVRAAAELGSKT